MNKNRPVNLDISTIQLPITAYVSILHRISGVALFAGVAVLLWMLEASLSSESSFEELKELTSSPLCKLILWATLAGLAYHMIAGIRHLIMDAGIGESLEGGQNGAKIALALAIITIAALGVWIW
ncbi:succinate dehydrogenase, cytochrome b556 subunit [Simiduia sp. 21SJ11W-1]|uniref:succinate dehydrogenase, cytochrome b556 subunit n=1 Tax=Simiduia sp. 21SJ11W-1 TaxID=2909669 RepID=UPI0020A0A23A|nr:succinate dehydrogenase, cytochrome b556 subunit [Simiduia sp. 21SJ11W-1]UTA46532.1 succinate dehydrogenase, cytochrome b556 subunit [Simiduia sp. 21SJ11W-1]